FRTGAALADHHGVPSIDRKWYTLIVRGDCTRFTPVYFLGKKSDAASAFESILEEVRAEGTPSVVMAVRSENGGKFFGGDFGKLCRKRGIKQEFTLADSPKCNDAAERALALINDSALAARIQASVLYPGAPTYLSLWAEVVSWACHVLNRTATTDNSGDKSPYKQLSPIAEEEVSAAEEGASGEGASSQGGRLGQRVRPRHDGGVAPGATWNARRTSGRTCSQGRGGCGRQPPDTIGLPREGRFRGHQHQQQQQQQ
ncbi:unnamed protein product, partial [Ascophyllum nodosum]